MHALELSAVTKRYRNGPHALKGVDLNVDEGDFFALLGPNGAGKSTLIGIVSSLVRKSGGSVKVFGHDLDRDPWAAKTCLGLVPQEFNFNGFEKVQHIVVNQAGYYGVPARIAHERAERYLNELGLWDKRDAAARALSGGMKRRLMIARALVHEPRLLILDEPTAGVDIELRRSMWDFLRNLNRAGTTIILTTHYLEEAELLCRNIGIIDEGRVIERTSIRSLLRKLSTHAFVLDVQGDLSQLRPPAGYAVRVLDDTTIEAVITAEQSLTELFEALSAQHITVVSMKNKSNRLEELFVRMLDKGARAGDAEERA